MIVIVFKLIFFLEIQQALSCSSASFKIINGEDASVWPWMVSLQSLSQNSHFCGGSIIASQYVLTAAHCLTSIGSFRIVAGTNDLKEENLTIFQVSKVTLHENYNSVTLENDIALIKLVENITESSKISTICLPNSADENNVINQQVYTAGWGYITPSGQNTEGILYETRLQISDNSTICPIVPNLHYCAYDPTPKKSNVCYGDSGGPLMYSSNGNWYLYGITSFVFADQNRHCINNVSSYFTKVPRYIDWVNKKMLGNIASGLNSYFEANLITFIILHAIML